MIAAPKRLSKVLDQHGRPIVIDNGSRAGRRRGDIYASYDAARNTPFMANYWAHADSYDADSSNRHEVRQRLVQRARYEVNNNGFTDGIAQTYANFLVGEGPSLRMQTTAEHFQGSEDPAASAREFNRFIETQWAAWADECMLQRKLWCMAHAYFQDGEAFAMIVNNPKCGGPVGLDWILIETDQCHTPFLPFGQVGCIDGIQFDEFRNPISYDILPQHPGGMWSFMGNFLQPERIPAKFILHWFKMRRPGQHRGVPQLASTLTCGGYARRYREATAKAAETAANLSVILTTMSSPYEGEEPDYAELDEFELSSGTMLNAPYGTTAQQLKAEYPANTFESYNRELLKEQARPANMPRGLAGGDSSDYNFASGKLDLQPFYQTLKVDWCCVNRVALNPLFGVWFERFALAYDLEWEPTIAPPHSWDWPRPPVGDEESEANAARTKLESGQASPSSIAASRNIDYDDLIEEMAADYGVSIDEMRRIMLGKLLGANPAPAGQSPKSNAPETAIPPAPQREVLNA